MSTRIIIQPHLVAPKILTCNTCVHYSRSMRCKLFGRVSLISGEVYTASVFEAREEDLCGVEGRYHKSDQFPASG